MPSFQVLQDEGLNRWVDPQCLQREIAEATNMTPEEMNVAAREIIRRSRNMDHSYDNDSFSGAQHLDAPALYRRSPSPQQQHEMQERTLYFTPDSVDRHAMVNVTSL